MRKILFVSGVISLAVVLYIMRIPQSVILSGLLFSCVVALYFLYRSRAGAFTEFPAEDLFNDPAFVVNIRGAVMRSNSSAEPLIAAFGNRLEDILRGKGCSEGAGYRLLNKGAPEKGANGKIFYAKPLLNQETLIVMSFADDTKKIHPLVSRASSAGQHEESIFQPDPSPFNFGFFEILQKNRSDQSQKLADAEEEITAVNDTLRRWLKKDPELKKFLANFGEKVRAVRAGESGAPQEDFFLENLFFTSGNDQDSGMFRILFRQTPVGLSEGFVFPVKNEIDSVKELPPSDAPDDRAYARILDICPAAMAICNADGEIVENNRAFKSLTGADYSGNREKKKIRDHFLEEDRDLWDRLTEGKKSVEMRLNYENNPYVKASFTKINHDDLGKPDQYAVFLIDLTDAKALEQKFNQSQKMQAVGQLAGGVAHDFNNLLTAILGHAELALARFDPGDPCFGDLMQIRQNANRAGGLVRQLLAFSRRQTLVERTVNLTEVLPDLMHLLHRTIGDKIKLVTDYGKDLYDLKLDIGQFERVIVNLAVNARDAMPDGGTLTIKTFNIDFTEDRARCYDIVTSGSYVAVFTEDTGFGMPESVRSKIFEPFFTTKEAGKGTGLGLSTVYGIVKQTGGFIFVFSEVERGTRFEIYLPRHVAQIENSELSEKILIVEEDKPIQNPIKALAEPEGVKPTATVKTILVAEDEDSVRSFVVRALTMRGYRVLEADCGEDALKIYQESSETIDAILSDVIMPGLDGPGWVAQARETDPNVKIVFMSGYAEDSYRKDPAQNDTAAFLQKPFSLQELTDMMRGIFND